MERLILTPEQLDALKEVGNIGAGNAATALSQLLKRPVSINVPQVRLLTLEELPVSTFLQNSEEVGIAVSSKILGSLRGGVLVLFLKKSALLMIDILMQRRVGSTEIFTLMDASAVSEISHILSCSYLDAVGEFLNLRQLIPSITQIAVDKASGLSKSLIKGFVEEKTNYILPIENNMLIEGTQISLFVIFLLEFESVKKILKLVGL